MTLKVHTFPLLEIEANRDRFRKSNLPIPLFPRKQISRYSYSSPAFARFPLGRTAGVRVAASNLEISFPGCLETAITGFTVYPGVDLQYQI